MGILKTFICQFCQKEYTSDGQRKPKSFRKDGSVYQYYDSYKFCSRDCCIKQTSKKQSRSLKRTYRLHPEIKQQQVKTLKRTLLDNPDIIKKSQERRRKTYESNLNILIKQVKARRETYKNNPEIQRRATQRYKETIRSNPKILEESLRKRKITLETNPDIERRRIDKLKRTLKNNPEIINKQRVKRSETYRNHPEILQRRALKRKQTYKNHPEILQNWLRKLLETKRKNKTFNTSKPEDDLYKLLLTKYSDVKRNYNLDLRYPYMCDFYIPSKDLFIELQASWTHGRRPFIANDASCQEQLNTWKQKASISNYYKNAIETWTKRDVLKRQTAEKNNLNYIEIWNIRDIWDIWGYIGYMKF